MVVAPVSLPDSSESILPTICHELIYAIELRLPLCWPFASVGRWVALIMYDIGGINVCPEQQKSGGNPPLSVTAVLYSLLADSSRPEPGITSGRRRGRDRAGHAGCRDSRGAHL